MRDQDKINRVQSLVSKETSGWREKAEYRKANRGWLKRSAEIAVRILTELRSKGISQAELARMMDVTPQHITKLVKGQENLTLETIGKIESVLNISLISVSNNPASGFGIHTLVDNIKMSETVDMVPDNTIPDDNVRPLYNYATINYYE